MLSDKKYQELRQKYDNYHAAADQFRKPNGWLVVDAEIAAQLPESPTHEEISALEVYEFVNNPPDSYFAYVSRKTGNLTTWTGEFLGTIAFGKSYQTNFGDRRVPISVDAINGKYYHGTFFESAGDYCRIKAYKG